MHRWLLPAVSVEVEQMLQILVCFHRSYVEISEFLDFSCTATVERSRCDVPLCIQAVAFISVVLSAAANLTVSSSAKCLFNLPKETRVVSLTTPAR